MKFFDSVKTTLIKKPFDLNGRASRSEYWNYWLFSQVSILLFLYFSLRIKFLLIFVILTCVYLIIPGISVTVRRLHDVNKSANWLLGFVPFTLSAYVALFVFSITQDSQTSEIDLFGILLIITYIVGIMTTSIWYCFPIFMFLTQKGNEEKNKYGDPVT